MFFFDRAYLREVRAVDLAAALLAACLVASANYVMNEILDGANDRHHPEKKHRPIPSGAVRVSAAWTEYGLLMAAGLLVAFGISPRFGWATLALGGMGTLYNARPFRLKDLPYLDVLSESVNNPIRMAMGWYATGYGKAPTLSVLLAYWMFGAFLMAAKRFAEYRHLADPARAAGYRKSFAHYTQERLLESILFYAALFSMFSGVFIARYRLELVLAVPSVAYCMAYYLHLAFKPDSAVQRPESLWRVWKLDVLALTAFGACAVLLFVDLPWLTRAFDPIIPPP